jgi:hypothetical protein
MLTLSFPNGAIDLCEGVRVKDWASEALIQVENKVTVSTVEEGQVVALLRGAVAGCSRVVQPCSAVETVQHHPISSHPVPPHSLLSNRIHQHPSAFNLRCSHHVETSTNLPVR